MEQTMTQALSYSRLKFNIDEPTLEECYLDGYQYARNELSEDNNPFAAGTSESEQWLEGWWAGFYEEEPIYMYSKDEIDQAPPQAEVKFMPQAAANEQSFEGNGATISKVAKVAAAVAATFLGYQVIDLIA